MAKTLTEKIIESHLLEGRFQPGSEIGITIDQTLTQDSTGTMVYLAFETMEINKIKTELSISYVDHNLLQTDFKNPDDHRFLASTAKKFGLYFSRPGNGICHQVHLERFGRPGKTLLGSDSHTPNSGALGSLAIGAGGLDVAAAMAGYPFYMACPKVMGIHLTGQLPDWVTGRDLILEMLGRLSVKGGVGFILEYFGPGVESLDIPSRATVANLGTELGATSSIWPSDENTRKFLKSQNREEHYVPLAADDGAEYDRIIEIDLYGLKPMIARPSSPDNVVSVEEIEGQDVSQVIVGSCANSSYQDLMAVAAILDGRTVAEKTSLEINPGSRQALINIIADGGLAKLVSAGARVQQSGCLGCIGIGQAPASNTISLRTFTRNFPGRSGTKDDQVYLCSPQTAAASALNGKITDPRKLGQAVSTLEPEKFIINHKSIIPPIDDGQTVEIIRGPNIKPFPQFENMADSFEGIVAIKVGDNITTDHIMPAGSEILPLRSNVPGISRYVFQALKPDFHQIAQTHGSVAVVGGENYGQGSSREHAALVPRYLGVKVKIVKSFARIHKANLINYGILPLTFFNREDYDQINEGTKLVIKDIRETLISGAEEFIVLAGHREIKTRLNASERERSILHAGGLLNLIKQESG